MKAETAALVRYRVAQAEESLQSAALLCRSNHLRSAVNRLYYACFYSVSALLLTEDRSSKRHSGISSRFGRYWIKPGHLPAEMGRFYHRLFEHRQEGDYGDLVAFEREDVEGWLQEGRVFVAQVHGPIAQRIPPE